MFRVRDVVTYSLRMQSGCVLSSCDEVESISEVSNVTEKCLESLMPFQFGQHLTTLLSVQRLPAPQPSGRDEARVKELKGKTINCYSFKGLFQRTN